MTYAAAWRVRELLLVATCSLVLTGACTTSETGVIDLAVASAPKPPAPPTMMMMPKPDTMPCMHDMDCMKATPRCDPTLGLCVECAMDADCADPHRPVCDLRTEKCVACTADAGCPMAPMPPPKPPPP
ncbi:MAG TPA: hypothetical protein VHC69_34285 [Polyangiaceae bacterium]|nr:hypothetical protein [Polyangiaceae bacterium]